MDLSHRFTVPTSVEETWAHFNDIAAVAECFPGAQLSSHEGDTFTGAVKVKLGPIALQYNGSGTFVEKDDAAHRFVIDAKGKDKRGNGTAGAKVTLSMAPAGSGPGTDVEVLTDLAITGKPAQFGRGVMQDVSDKLLGQFVTCLETRLGGAAPAEVAPVEVAPAEAGPEAAVPDVAAESPPTAGVVGPSEQPAPPPRHAAPAPPRDEAINLGSTVLPVLAKAYWKQGLALLVLIALIIWWLVH
ncbi:MAG: SRPBCC family protein [Nocardioides sp.]